jgi:hypothetical protein
VAATEEDSATEITEDTEGRHFIKIFEYSVLSVPSVARVFCPLLCRSRRTHDGRA